MAGPNGGVWGNEVIVPAGEKLSPQTAQYVTPAGGTQEGGDAENASGDENTGGDDRKQSAPETPVVRLPDGTEVPVSEYDPYAEQRANLEKEQSRLDGMLSVVSSNGNTTETPGENNTGTVPSEHPLLADNPLLQKIEVTPDEAALLGEDERARIEQHNNLVDYARQQNQQIVDMETNFSKELNFLKDTVGDRFVREDIARVTATTGVTEQELLAASKATGVTDVQTLATLVVGEKAMQQSNEAAAAAAEAKRVEEAARISGTTQGAGGGGSNTQPEGRGVKDWRDPQAVGAAYKFGLSS